jgi:hypothetical protein
MKEPYNLDEYSQMWFPKAEELAQIAAEAEKAGEKEKASEYYLYACTIYALPHTSLTSSQTKLGCLSFFPIPCATIREAKVRLEDEQGNLLQGSRVCQA